MLVLVAYDVETATPAGRRRLRRVARVCQDYGVRVQKSLFECSVGPAERLLLKSRLLSEIDEERDSLRLYYLSDDVRGKTEHYGIARPLDPEGLLLG